MALGAQLLTLPTSTVVLDTDFTVHTAHAYEAPAPRKQTRVASGANEAQVRAYFADVPVMAEIAACESHFVHIDPNTGDVLRGRVNSKDVGVMQINEVYHNEAAKSMGLDLHLLNDNMRYARYLYDKEGTRPWSASSGCWYSKSLAMR